MTPPLTSALRTQENILQNFKCIESLRAYMAWWVVLSHGVGLIGIYDTGSSFFNLFMKLITWATMPVNIFIIVSGFVITHLLLNKKENYSVYITRRFFRIFPIYIFCILLAIFLANLRDIAYLDVSFLPDKSGRIATFAAQNEHFWTHFFLHITMLHGLVPDSLLPHNTSAFLGPAWSLSLEWQFYVLAPIIIGLMARGLVPMIITTLVLYLFGLVAKSGVIGTWNYPAFLFTSIQYFLIGILSRFIIERFKNHERIWELPIVALVTIALANTIESLIWIGCFTIALIESRRITNVPVVIQKVLNVFVLNKVVGNLGKWSYSTYLIHLTLFSLVVGGYASIFGTDVSLKKLILLMLSCVPIIIFASWALYSTIEVGGIALGKRVITRIKQSNDGQVTLPVSAP
ncbi:MAG: acyltransferase [Gammaproteobacteria bacterium]|nr:MAG: acyltransferase [Gammaproteobacteria bacterium]